MGQYNFTIIAAAKASPAPTLSALCKDRKENDKNFVY